MGAFLLIAVGLLLCLIGFCRLLLIGLRKDTLEHDMAYLWENYPQEIRNKIRKTFE